LNAGFTCETTMCPSQRRLIVLGSLALCAMGLSACQTTGAPEKNAALGVAQASPRTAAVSAELRQAQAKTPSSMPKQVARPDLPTVIGVAF
jgi:hypothetical protein